MNCFVDTSAFYAILDADDRNHPAVRDQWRRQLSLVDCISFDVMHRHGIRWAFAFDSHFKEQGFVCPPPPALR